MFAFPPGQFTRNNLFEDLFLFSRWEQEQNDPEGGSSQSFLLLSGIRTQERQPPGVLGLPVLGQPLGSFLPVVAPDGRQAVLEATQPGQGFLLAMCFLLLLPTRNGSAEDSTLGGAPPWGRGGDGMDVMSMSNTACPG